MSSSVGLPLRRGWIYSLLRLLRLCTAFPKPGLVIAGPDDEGYGQHIKRLLHESDLTDRTTFTGMLDDGEMKELMAATDVWVLPSYDENFGIAVVEAMAAGLAIVISNNVHIWPEVVAADAGVVVTCHPKLLADAIVRLLSDPGRRRHLGANAKRNRRALASRNPREE